ncbi:hypothetical protein [Morganella morganii]|uniref:hypothetical protein n=1 Tax=Morganella morganii TaxID=582 RepID=UPI00187BD132|nr:hypothetical protein [Morganella morganii]
MSCRSAADVERLGLMVQSTEHTRVEVEQEYGVPGNPHGDRIPEPKTVRFMS